MYKEMTRTHPNESLDTLISLSHHSYRYRISERFDGQTCIALTTDGLRLVLLTVDVKSFWPVDSYRLTPLRPLVSRLKNRDSQV